MTLYVDHRTHRVESTYAKPMAKVDANNSDKWVFLNIAVFVAVTFFALWLTKFARYGGVL